MSIAQEASNYYILKEKKTMKALKLSKKQQRLQNKVENMNDVVNRNKLKNSGISIDKMVALIQSKGISINYRG